MTKLRTFLLSLVSALWLGLPSGAQAGTAVTSEGGKYFDEEGNPTYKVAEDRMVDWFTYNGYRRYHSTCHRCHGPDGMGSSFAPALADSRIPVSCATPRTWTPIGPKPDRWYFET